MYKLVEIKKGIGGLYITKNYMYYTLESKKYQLYVCDSKNASDIIFISEEERVNDYEMYGDNLIYISRNEEYTYLVNLKTKVKNHINKVLYDLVDNYYQENENFYDDKNENIIYIYDLISGNIKKKINKTLVGYPKLNTDNYVITTEDTHIYTYQKSDFSLLWQKDIRDFFNKEDSKDNQLRIQEIYAYKDNFIVVSTFGILSLNQQDGSLIWKTESYARTMEIVGYFGYVCTGGSLYRVNLDNGQMYDYGREYARLPDFEYEGKSYWASGHRVVFHDGLLWYLVYASGDSFVIAIDPENAEYQWIHKIDTYEKADEIQFHQDKMFISDTGGNLFIYEKI